jgi:hypothetical protein
MNKIIIAAVTAALMLVPATALAHHGHKHHRDHKVHRVDGNVGTVTSYDSASGELVITTTKGRALSGVVTDRTEIECNGRPEDTTASTSRHGDDDQGDDNGDDQGDDDQGNDTAANCDASDLVAGAAVRRARIDLDGDDAVWTKVKLAA